MHGTPSLKPSRPAWKKSGKNSSTNSDEVYGTVDWGCFRPVTTRNQPVTIDFDHRRLLLGSISQGKKKREKKSEKKWENLEIRRCSPGSRSISHKLLGASRGESLAITGRRKRRWMYGLLAKALWGDFFSVHGLLGEKE
ncbi:hypothetical protein BHE74_00003806 [Ensete ventricosum]|nr:hypothetical protein BHE74_00003806 [Ensete ventricosum]